MEKERDKNDELRITKNRKICSWVILNRQNLLPLKVTLPPQVLMV